MLYVWFLLPTKLWGQTIGFMNSGPVSQSHWLDWFPRYVIFSIVNAIMVAQLFLVDKSWPVYARASSWYVAGGCWQSERVLEIFRLWIAKPEQSFRLHRACIKLQWMLEPLYMVVFLLTHCSDVLWNEENNGLPEMPW